MKYCIVGVGNLGASIANYLIMLQTPGKGGVGLYEPHLPNRRRAGAEYLDLLPIAKARHLSLTLHTKLPRASVYIVTCGLPRKTPKVTKRSLLVTNLPIVRVIVEQINEYAAIYVATNPPKAICKELGRGIPLRACTDKLRASVGEPTHINEAVLTGKGFTSFTPGYAIATQVIAEVG